MLLGQVGAVGGAFSEYLENCREIMLTPLYYPLPTNSLAGDDVRVELLLEGKRQPEDGDGVVHGLLEAAANHK